jgi:hypothetical protein
MSKITKSGFYYDEAGQLVLVTQGLGGYTLVTNKKILFRLYMNLSAASCITVLARVTYKLLGFTITRSMVIPSGSLLIDDADPLGSNVGILFTGGVFPFPSSFGGYSVEFDVYGASPSMSHFALKDMVFLPSGRLRLLIHNVIGMSPWSTKIESNITWLFEMFKGLERLSAMMPVRDGIKLGLTHTDAGICFTYGEELDAWPAICPSGSAPPCTPGEIFDRNMRETREINASGTAERVDATVVWRPRDLAFPSPGGEGMGGRAISYNSPPGTGLAGVVGGNKNGKEFTGALLGQEIGHLFGLEPPDSPHFDDPMNPRHSKDPVLNDPFAFDFYHLKPYRPTGTAFLGDVMSTAVWQGSDMTLYNAFDWEHLRQKFVKLPGVASSSARAKRSAKEKQDGLVATLDAAFTGAAIKVKNPGEAMPDGQGLAWHWTAHGFQPVAKGGGKKGASVMAPGVEGLRSWLADLGVTEFYAPVGDRPLPMVIDPDATPKLEQKGLGGMYWL